MELESINVNNKILTKTDKIKQGTNFKGMFKFVSDELLNIAVQLADTKTNSIKIRDKEFKDKNNMGVTLFITSYMNDLNQLTSLLTQTLQNTTKIADEASKMVG